MGVFNSASIRIQQREHERVSAVPSHLSNEFTEVTIPIDQWVRSVVQGADEHSPRSRHLFVLGGVLIGFSNQEEDHLSTSLRSTLQSAFVTATNLALEDPNADEFQHLCISLALNHTFPHLSDYERSQLDYDRLLPILMHSMLHSAEGLRSGYFLSVVDADVQQASANQFNWPAASSSFFQIQKIVGSPLVTSIGPLSRLIAHAVEQVRDHWLAQTLVEDITDFTRTLHAQWRANKLSEIDATEDPRFLHPEAIGTTLPVLWRLLRTTLFSVVVILRSAVGRVLNDGRLAQDNGELPSLVVNLTQLIPVVAPDIAQQTLHSLCNLNFIFARLGSSAFTQYTFTYLTAIDILASYPTAASHLLRALTPKQLGQIPTHPLDRTHDLFFLNLSEHFTLILPQQLTETLVLPALTPYLTSGSSPNLLPIFEAAHSVTLSIFSSPQNSILTTTYLPTYVHTLFTVFPHNLSARQFRLAFQNLVRITSPPSEIAVQQPMLAETLLELLRFKALSAPVVGLSDITAAVAGGRGGAEETTTTTTMTTGMGRGKEQEGLVQQQQQELTEQAVLVLTMIDSLPCLALDLLEEWLGVVAGLVGVVAEPGTQQQQPQGGGRGQGGGGGQLRDYCKRHLWETMVGGGMDAERSQRCVAWWSTRGGREQVLFGDEGGGDVHGDKRSEGTEHMMSGALAAKL